MASGVQQGATHAKVDWVAAGYPEWHGTATLPVVDEDYGTLKVFVGFHPFASHAILARSWESAYEAFIDAAADILLIDDEALKDYIVGHDEDGNPEFSEVEWTSGGEPVDTCYVQIQEISLAAVTWLYRP